MYKLIISVMDQTCMVDGLHDIAEIVELDFIPKPGGKIFIEDCLEPKQEIGSACFEVCDPKYLHYKIMKVESYSAALFYKMFMAGKIDPSSRMLERYINSERNYKTLNPPKVEQKANFDDD